MTKEMKIKVFEVKNSGFLEVDYELFVSSEQNQSSICIVDIQVEDRKNAFKELEKLSLPSDVIERLLTPADNIRFEYFNEIVYGELSFFSSKIRKEHYAGIIIHNNWLIGIHSGSESLFSNVANSFSAFSDEQKQSINIDILLYSFTLEYLSNYGKLLLTYRQEVELMAQKLDSSKTAITPKDIWQAKLQAATFLQSLDKLDYTLSFPPTKEILDNESPYLKSFEFLLKNLSLIKASLNQLENRLDSLNDHYNLMLQSKLNKRLNILTIVQAVFVPLTLITGLYGMNFENIPGLNLKYGYHFSLLLMGGISVISIRYFYKNEWFK